ncbi:MAG: exodeoxyribonuclease III [Pseudomonadota bacterium]
MRIATWNVNSVRVRSSQLAQFAKKYQPDVIALQETKANDYAFPNIECMAMGYQHIRLSGESGYNGVAILSKYPLVDDFALEFYNHDKRHIAVKIGDIEIHNFYVPAGGDEPDPEINHKFKHKLAYLDLMHEWFMTQRSSKQKVVLVGDLNVAPLEHDVWSSKQLQKVISHTDIERKMLMRNMQEFGFIDAPRLFVDEQEKLYSWWTYRTPDWQASNRGRRLDHIWVSEGLRAQVLATSFAVEMRSLTQPSDHIPVIIDIKL